MLSTEELLDLEEEVRQELPERLLGALSLANEQGRLQELLDLLLLPDLLEPENKYETHRDGKIVVVGGSAVNKDVLLAIAKGLGINKDRFEFCLGYDDAKRFNFKKLQYAPNYRVVLVGPMPHSVVGKDDNSSIIARMENVEGFPRVERLIGGRELKITKSNFREKLQELITEDYI